MAIESANVALFKPNLAALNSVTGAAAATSAESTPLFGQQLFAQLQSLGLGVASNPALATTANAMVAPPANGTPLEGAANNSGELPTGGGKNLPPNTQVVLENDQALINATPASSTKSSAHLQSHASEMDAEHTEEGSDEAVTDFNVGDDAAALATLVMTQVAPTPTARSSAPPSTTAKTASVSAETSVDSTAAAGATAKSAAILPNTPRDPFATSFKTTTTARVAQSSVTTELDQHGALNNTNTAAPAVNSAALAALRAASNPMYSPSARSVASDLTTHMANRAMNTTNASVFPDADPRQTLMAETQAQWMPGHDANDTVKVAVQAQAQVQVSPHVQAQPQAQLRAQVQTSPQVQVQPQIQTQAQTVSVTLNRATAAPQLPTETTTVAATDLMPRTDSFVPPRLSSDPVTRALSPEEHLQRADLQVMHTDDDAPATTSTDSAESVISLTAGDQSVKPATSVDVRAIAPRELAARSNVSTATPLFNASPTRTASTTMAEHHPALETTTASPSNQAAETSTLARHDAVLPNNHAAAEIRALAQVDIPVGQDGWHENFSRNVADLTARYAEQARLADQQASSQAASLLNGRFSGTAEVHLNPPDLGPVEIRIRLEQDQASIQFIASHASTREAIESAMPRLREMLSDQQLTLADVNVSQQSTQQQPNHQQQGQGQQQAQQFFQQDRGQEQRWQGAAASSGLEGGRDETALQSNDARTASNRDGKRSWVA